MSARRWLGSVLLLALAGCATALPTPRAPVREEARRALALLLERWHAFADLRTLVEVDLRRGGDRQRLTGVLLARAPGSVRFEALSPFGQPFLLVAIDGGRLTAYNAARNEALIAPATAETTARYLHLPFDADDLVGVLAGLPVPPKDLRVAHLLPRDEHGPSLELVGALHRQRVWMDLATGVVRQIEITGGRAEALIVYRRRPDGTLAGFDVTTGGEYLRAAVRYRDPVIDAGVEPERFRLTVPAGARIEQVR